MRVTSDVGPWSVVPEWVLDAEVSDRAVRLYALLGRYADNHGKAFPLRRTLAERLRCSVNSLDRAVRELIAAGALVVTQRRTDQGDLTSSLYTLITVPPVGRGTPTSGATGTPTGEAENESQKERETSVAAAPRARNEIWDALTVMFGEPATPTATRLRGKTAAELKQAGATAEEILARGKRWPLHFDGATLTETALVKHWATLPRKPLRAGR